MLCSSSETIKGLLKVKTKYVISSCKNRIRSIKEYQKQIDEERIEKKKQDLEWRWGYLKYLGMKKPTRESTIKYLNEYGPSFGWRFICGWGDVYDCQEILSAAERNKNINMYLSTEAINTIRYNEDTEN